MGTHRMHGRLPWLSLDDLNPQAREVYDSITGGDRALQAAYRMVSEDGRLEGPFNSMLYSPELGDALQSLGSALRFKTTLGDREREIAVLTLAASLQSDFEWYAHEAVGSLVGLSNTEILSIKKGHAAITFSPTEELTHAATLELICDRQLSDDILSTMVIEVGYTGVQELISLVGYYELLDLLMRVWRTPLPEGINSPFIVAEP